jgi:protein TonB
MFYKRSLILIASFLFCSLCFAQKKDTIVTKKPDKVFIKIDKAAEFPGGSEAWQNYLKQNLRLPTKPIGSKKKLEVRVTFLVGEDGTVYQVRALDDPGNGLAEEAERVIASSGPWLPAEHMGKKVEYPLMQVITFKFK